MADIRASRLAFPLRGRVDGGLRQAECGRALVGAVAVAVAAGAVGVLTAAAVLAVAAAALVPGLAVVMLGQLGRAVSVMLRVFVPVGVRLGRHGLPF